MKETWCLQSSATNPLKVGHCVLLGCICLALILVLASVSCEPGGEPIIENRSNQDLGIYITDVYPDGRLDKPRYYGLVPAQSTKRLAGIVFVQRQWVYRIEAVDLSGKVVFSRDFDQDDLDRISWKITIPP